MEAIDILVILLAIQSLIFVLLKIFDFFNFKIQKQAQKSKHINAKNTPYQFTNELIVSNSDDNAS